MKNLYNDDYNTDIYTKVDKKYTLIDFLAIKEEFEMELSYIIDEIFDPAIDFIQTPNEKTCLYCTFKNLCNR
jgi:hypothetical protein